LEGVLRTTRREEAKSVIGKNNGDLTLIEKKTVKTFEMLERHPNQDPDRIDTDTGNMNKINSQLFSKTVALYELYICR